MLLLATIWGHVTEVNTLPAQPTEVRDLYHIPCVSLVLLTHLPMCCDATGQPSATNSGIVVCKFWHHLQWKLQFTENSITS